MPFETIENLRKRINENPDVTINICDVDDTLITVEEKPINETATKRVLKGNVFAVATSRATSIKNQDDKNPLTPFIKETHTHQDIIVGSAIKVEEWKQAEKRLVTAFLSEAFAFNNTVVENLAATFEQIYKIVERAELSDLVCEDELLMLMIDVLSRELKKSCSSDQYNKYLLNLVELYQKDKKALSALPENIVRQGYYRFKSILTALIISNDNVEVFKRCYGNELQNNDLQALTDFYDSLKKSTENPKNLFEFVKQQLAEKQQQYYNSFTKAVEILLKFLTVNDNETDAIWKALVEEVNRIKVAYNFSDNKMAFEAIYEAMGYFNPTIKLVKAKTESKSAKADTESKSAKADSEDKKTEVDTEKLKAKIKAEKLMTDIDLGNLNGNFQTKLDKGLQNRKNESGSLSMNLPVAAANNHITIEKNKDHLFIYLDKGLPTEIKLSLPNNPALKYSHITSNKLKQFLEICYQLRVISDKTPPGISLTCRPEITRIDADRFIFIDDAKGPVKIASILGFKSYQVLSEAVVAQRLAALKSAKTNIKKLFKLADNIAMLGARSQNNYYIGNNLIFIGKFIKLLPGLKTCFAELLSALPDDFTKECEFLNKALAELAQCINVETRVGLSGGNIHINDDVGIFEKIQDISKLLNDLNTTLQALSEKLEKLKNNYIDQIMDHRNRYACRLKETPSAGLDVVLRELELATRRSSSLFSIGPTTVAALPESHLLTLQRLADYNNSLALEALGSYFHHQDRDSRRIRACFQLAYLYCVDSNRPKVLLDKICLSERVVNTDKSSTSSAHEIARFNSLEAGINNNFHLNGMIRLCDIYRYMAAGDVADESRRRQNLVMAFQYNEIAFQLISPVDIAYQTVKSIHQELLNFLQPEQIRSAYTKLMKWYQSVDSAKLLEKNPRIDGTEKYREYLHDKLRSDMSKTSTNQETFAQYMAKHYQAECERLIASPAAAAGVKSLNSHI